MSLLNAIDSAVGIQHQGITDKSGSDAVLRLTNGLIVGDFGRGRVDQPMFVTKDTLSQLGDESKPAYQTVADCLDTGVPGVWVMRTSTALPVIPDCLPTSLIVPFVAVSDLVELYYRVDYGDEIGTVEMYQINALETNARSVLSELFVESVGGLVDLVVGSGGGIAPFQYLQSSGDLVGGGTDTGVDEESASPITINLLTFEDAGVSGDYDFVTDVFGESVSVHSCSLQNWQGV